MERDLISLRYGGVLPADVKARIGDELKDVCTKFYRTHGMNNKPGLRVNLVSHGSEHHIDAVLFYAANGVEQVIGETLTKLLWEEYDMQSIEVRHYDPGTPFYDKRRVPKAAAA